ncbi:MAG: hypothetical protein AABX03_00975 [Nanoarchaeota archaeon]
MVNGSLVIDTSNINDARKDIDKAFSLKKVIIVVARGDEFNRKILENKKVDLFLLRSLSESGRNSRLKQRDSGLNQVLCALAKENNITFGLDFNFLVKNKDNKDYFSRVMQNIRLFNKYKSKFILINSLKVNRQDLNGFLLSLGLNTEMTKYAIENSFDLD